MHLLNDFVFQQLEHGPVVFDMQKSQPPDPALLDIRSVPDPGAPDIDPSRDPAVLDITSVPDTSELLCALQVLLLHLIHFPVATIDLPSIIHV